MLSRLSRSGSALSERRFSSGVPRERRIGELYLEDQNLARHLADGMEVAVAARDLEPWGGTYANTMLRSVAASGRLALLLLLRRRRRRTVRRTGHRHRACGPSARAGDDQADVGRGDEPDRVPEGGRAPDL